MNAISEYRKAHRKTLEDVAQALGVDRATVCRWEAGEINLTAERAVQIEKVLGIPRAKLRPDLWG